MFTTNDTRPVTSPAREAGSTVRSSIALAAAAAVLLFALSGCSDSMQKSEQTSESPPDAKNAEFHAGGKADSSLSETRKEKILHVANTYGFSKLDAFLHEYAARGIVDRRRQEGRYDSLEDLDEAYWVGPHALEQLSDEAATLPDSVVSGSEGGSALNPPDPNAVKIHDEYGGDETVVAEGPLAADLQALFDRAYGGTDGVTGVDCDTTDGTSCSIDVGSAELRKNDPDELVSMSNEDSNYHDTTRELYRALEKVGEWVNPQAGYEFRRINCTREITRGPYGGGVGYECDILKHRVVSLKGGDGAIPELGASRIWEGWLIVDGEPVTTGHFRASSGQSVYHFTAEVDEVKNAAKFVLTIEPSDEPEGTPSAQKYLAGGLKGESARLTTTKGPTLSGVDLSSAAGQFFLAAPSGRNNPETDYRNGIWFIDNSNGPSAGLDLPELGEGWTYEGWVVKKGVGPVSTGRFDDPSAADSDMGGPFAGEAGTPPFPGQDFVMADGRRDLTSGYKAVISVEPQPDDSPKPFAPKPLAGSISDAGKGALQQLSSKSLPTAEVVLPH